jgi:ABC-type branched-subunit amino acid transport system substrate-binding protein
LRTDTTASHDVTRGRNRASDRFAFRALIGAASAALTLSGAVLLAPEASAKGTTFTGTPLLVATQSAVGTPFGDVPQVFAGVQAAARAINKAGGINGHRVDVMTCNGASNPNTEVQCATTAVKAGAVAFVGDFPVLNPTGVANVIAAANTADVAAFASAPSQFSGSNVFPLGFFPARSTVCTTPALSRVLGRPSKVASVAIGIPTGVLQAQVVSTSAMKQGGSRVAGVGTVTVSLTTADFSSTVAQVAGLGTNLAYLATTPTQQPAFITAASSAGKTWAYCTNEGALPASTLLKLEAASRSVFEASAYPPLSAARNFATLRNFIAQMRAEQASGDSAASVSTTGYNSLALNSWLGMQVFAQVARSINGTIDNATFLSKVKTAKVNFGIIPPIDFSKPIGTGAYPKVFNDRQYLLRWSGKDFVLVPSGTVNHSLPISGLG